MCTDALLSQTEMPEVGARVVQPKSIVGLCYYTEHRYAGQVHVFASFAAVPQSLYGQQINGLMGVYNGNSSDDFLSRNGTLLSVNSTEKELFYNFGQTCELKL